MKNRASDIAALLSNWSQVIAAEEAATNSAGTAAAENEKYMESLQGSLDAFTASWQALSNTFLNSDFLKGLVDSGATVLDILDSIINTFQVIPTVVGAVFAGLSLKNVGRDKTFSPKFKTEYTDNYMCSIGYYGFHIIPNEIH